VYDYTPFVSDDQRTEFPSYSRKSKSIKKESAIYKLMLIQTRQMFGLAKTITFGSVWNPSINHCIGWGGFQMQTLQTPGDTSRALTTAYPKISSTAR
jgi:hypothetical protein